ncbi:suppressor for copper-sensitivity B [Shewanella sairae]|uniref:Suppressor for copper-sensitivity B n=2 Tax=Shewanella sairae TaxID=190310 RepID=A0ABQ4P2I8_9GAMM|nr:protein-disulfide reductase DsbD domain-containing protein [Shewanella sairae]MCL1129712.1 thioredoxin family protein [Shewanella sairae]GIU41366.1 suppressor for copper-sensitivity B [Shewanella sairae]
MKILKLIMLVWLIALANPLFAQSTGWLENPNHPPVKVRFMLTGELDKATNTVPGVLEVELDGDWKTYWRSPGEGGIAPSIDWSGSSNLNQVDWGWPAPEQFSLLGLQTFGYHNQAAFPMQLQLDDTEQATHLQGKFTLSSCTNVCVLTDYNLSLDIDPSVLNADVDAMFAYNKAVSMVPVKLQREDVELGWDAKEQQLQVVMNDDGWTLPKFIIDGEPDTTFKFVRFERDTADSGQDKLRAIFDATSWLGEPELLGKSLNLTVMDNQRSLEFATKVKATTVQSSSHSLLSMLVIALLGGLILNVMPCVLPVLGMKLSSVIAAPNLQKSQIRQQFIASALGILVSFWLLAAFILTLKFTGQAIGWGVQFQNPWFIGFMALVTAVFAVNMLGVFEINLPSSLQTKLATTGGNDHRGHFLQGMFATLLATPCSAPFLGTAVAFALGADVLSLLVIFTALAVGMALPWLIVAAFPQVAGYFPKPGRWMNVVKVVFSGLLLLTSLWLISLLASFIAASYLWIIAALLVLVFMLFITRLYGKAALIASFSLGVLALAIGAFATSDKWAQPLPSDLDWAPLNEAQIQTEVAAGKTVFVDVTADWCITCKANKVGVILQDPVYSGLQADNIILMKGDWTKPSKPITAYLQSHNRFGVPFNVVYGPNAPDGIELPVILSASEVIDAIERASVKR